MAIKIIKSKKIPKIEGTVLKQGACYYIKRNEKTRALLGQTGWKNIEKNEIPKKTKIIWIYK
jgi:hypothetical protein